MCRRTTCPACGKPTYAGCGAHVEAVLADVPVAERCKCGEARERRAASPEAPPPPDRKPWWKRL